MTRPRTAIIVIAATTAVLCFCLLFWRSRPNVSAPVLSTSDTTLGTDRPDGKSSTYDLNPTLVYAHNLLLRKGPNFRIYIRWIRGQLVRTHRSSIQSFDDPESFVLQIQKGVIHTNIGDISNYLEQQLSARCTSQEHVASARRRPAQAARDHSQDHFSSH